MHVVPPTPEPIGTVIAVASTALAPVDVVRSQLPAADRAALAGSHRSTASAMSFSNSTASSASTFAFSAHSMPSFLRSRPTAA